MRDSGKRPRTLHDRGAATHLDSFPAGAPAVPRPHPRPWWLPLLVTLVSLLPVAACEPLSETTTSTPPSSTDERIDPLPGYPLPPAVVEAFHAWTCLAGDALDAPPATLHVATEGADDQDGRTPERALATLQAAVDRSQPGDVIWLHEGVYEQATTVRRSGTESAPILLTAAPGACVTLQGDRHDAPNGAAREAVLTLDGVRHITVQNLTVRFSRSEGILILDGHDVTLDRLDLHDNTLSGLTTIGGSNHHYRRILAHHNDDDAGGGDSDGISISSGTGHHVEHVAAFANSDDGVDTWLSVGTTLDHVLAFDNGRAEGDGNGIKAGGRDAQVDTLVQRSIAFGNRTYGFTDNTGRGVTFRSNTAYGNGKEGFAILTSTLTGNLSFGNEGGAVWWGGTPTQNEENGWNLALDVTVLRSVDPVDPAFLMLRDDASLPPVGALHDGHDLATWLLAD